MQADDDVPLILKFSILIIIGLIFWGFPLFAQETTISNIKSETQKWDYGTLRTPIILQTERTPRELKNVTYYGNGSCVSYVQARTGIKMGGWAGTFMERAEESGYSTSTEPIIGSIMVTSEGGGHVAVVEDIKNNTIYISEQNYTGLYIVSNREIQKDDPLIRGYIY